MNEREFLLTTVQKPRSLCLDGINDRVVVNDQFTLPDDFSAFAWIKAPEQDPGVILCQWNESDNTRQWLMQAQGTELEVQVSANGIVAALTVVTTALNVFDDEWKYVGFTFKDGELKLYVNGVLVESDSAEIVLYTANQPLLMGCKNWKKKTDFCKGLLFETQVFKVGLTDAEVLENYGDGDAEDLSFSSSLPKVKARWRFDDFPVATDSIGGKNGQVQASDGSLSGDYP